jgi:hypothetical protein
MDTNAAIHLPVCRYLIFALFATGCLALIEVFFFAVNGVVGLFFGVMHI